MKKSEYIARREQYAIELARQDGKNSTGSIGKMCEVVLRNFINVNGISSANDVKSRNVGKADIKRKDIGEIEVKTGSGAVNYGQFTMNDLIADNVLPTCNYIAWSPFTTWAKGLNADSMERLAPKMTFMFSREQFIDCLETIGKNGLRSSLKLSKGGNQINVQTITPKMESRLWDYLENYKIPTVEQFFSDL